MQSWSTLSPKCIILTVLKHFGPIFSLILDPNLQNLRSDFVHFLFHTEPPYRIFGEVPHLGPHDAVFDLGALNDVFIKDRLWGYSEVSSNHPTHVQIIQLSLTSF